MLVERGRLEEDWGEEGTMAVRGEENFRVKWLLVLVGRTLFVDAASGFES